MSRIPRQYVLRRFSEEPSAPRRGLQIWLILVGKAHARQTITYGALADLLGFERAGTLAPLLGHVMFFCRASGLPPLTVLVVNQETGRPGDGLTGVEDVDRARERVFQYDW